jgi:hypothetical protein
MHCKCWDKPRIWQRSVEALNGDHNLKTLMSDTAVCVRQYAASTPKKKVIKH